MEIRSNVFVDGYVELKDNTSGVVPAEAHSGKLYKKIGDNALYWKGENYGEEINITSPSGSVFNYLSRTNLTITSGSIENFGNTSGKYTFYKSDNPKIYSSVIFNSGDDDVVIDVPYYDTMFSSTSGNIGTVNIFADTTNLYMENKYVSGVTFKYYREI